MLIPPTDNLHSSVLVGVQPHHWYNSLAKLARKAAINCTSPVFSLCMSSCTRLSYQTLSLIGRASVIPLLMCLTTPHTAAQSTCINTSGSSLGLLPFVMEAIIHLSLGSQPSHHRN